MAAPTTISSRTNSSSSSVSSSSSNNKTNNMREKRSDKTTSSPKTSANSDLENSKLARQTVFGLTAGQRKVEERKAAKKAREEARQELDAERVECKEAGKEAWLREHEWKKQVRAAGH